MTRSDKTTKAKTTRQNKQDNDQSPAVSEPGKTKPDTRPKNIPIEDILYYKSKNLSHSEIGKLIGCDPSNISNRLAAADIQGLENYRQFKDSAFEHLQREINKNITLDDIKKAPLQSKVLAMGLLQDKIQVIRGLATDNININVISATLTEATERMRKAGLMTINSDSIAKPGLELDNQILGVTTHSGGEK